MKVELFDFELPEALVARRPAEERDGARLLVLPAGGAPLDRAVRDLPELVAPGSLLVVNDTRVIPARLFGRKATGGRVEILLVERESSKGSTETWVALARASKPMRPGAEIAIDGGLAARVVEGRDAASGALVLELSAASGTVAEAIERAGHVPLPPYVGRDDDADDRERYQTVYARSPGAVAAPTAGLHLSERLLAALRERRVGVATVTLHVSLGTFQPVQVDDLDRHPMHSERYEVGPEAALAVAAARERGAPIVAVGTTSVRALESAADPDRFGRVRPVRGRTDLLIQPGYRFRVVDRLLTNFHLPRSTLLALVSAFAGRERVLAAYRHAVARGYRFYSYGDAMLLDRAGSGA